MTTYGTIPTTCSSSSPLAPNIPTAEQRIEATLGVFRPWKTMFNFSSFDLPAGLHDAVSRIRINLTFFRMNYTEIVFICLLPWYPFSLLAVLMAIALFTCFTRFGPKLVIFGRPINDRVVLMAMCLLTEVVMLLIHTQATLNFMVAVLAVVAATAVTYGTFRKTEDLSSEEENEEASRSSMRNLAACVPLALLILVTCLLFFFFGRPESIPLK